MKNSIKNLIAALIFFGLFLATVEYLSAGEVETVENVTNAIDYLITDNDTGAYVIEFSTEYKTELAQAFLGASSAYKIDVYLLVAIGYRESVFRMTQVGDNGRSLGIMQTGTMARRSCECSMDTVQGQIDCGACWLDKGRKWCGTIESGLTAYASGVCEAPNMRTKRAVRIRFKLAEILKGLKNEI